MRKHFIATINVNLYAETWEEAQQQLIEKIIPHLDELSTDGTEEIAPEVIAFNEEKPAHGVFAEMA